MDVYRSPMEKILEQGEGDVVITDPKAPGKTFLRKMAYLSAYWLDKLRRIFKRRPGGPGQA